MVAGDPLSVCAVERFSRQLLKIASPGSKCLEMGGCSKGMQTVWMCADPSGVTTPTRNDNKTYEWYGPTGIEIWRDFGC
ncbi:hypothetical protein FIV00_05145 [Labrenzia sp. THAF82]|nr:hypothetical protein FIV00_05145 [Labrenzia sp. THAF82]